MMLHRWFVEDQGAVNVCNALITAALFNHDVIQAHLWEDNKAVVAWLQTQIDHSDSKSTLMDNIKTLQKDALSQQVIVCFI